MFYSFLADTVVVLHAIFVVFAVLGGFLVWRWKKVAWVHVPAAVWGALIEFAEWICPLTPLENWLRIRAGEAGYTGGFIEHHLVPILYPPGLTPTLQVLLGLLVLAINGAVYGRLLIHHRRRKRDQRECD
jgi:hypothetical protein